MKTSQKATRLNAIATFISGIGILVFQKQLMSIFEINNDAPFLVVGGVITFFSLTMFIEIKKQRALAILWIITQDLLFVLASIYILITQPFNISDTGYLLIGLFLIPIIFFIIYQSIGLAKIDSKNGTRIKTLSFKRKVKAHKSRVWQGISDVANYHKVAPNIDSSKVVSGEKKGMVRSCSHGKDSWTETCTLWEDEKQYSFTVNTSAPDYPYPLKSLKGIWIVNESSDNKNEIVMIFEFEYKNYLQNILIHPLMKHRFTKVCAKLLDNWQNKIE
ncbi:type II toxin-antitoxin system RatA family toxin [Flavivirga rizhaonensis]|uniref:SRPBCC family protein n=1 Tax=Flavivirga rizhaonensis TaxID=2559571 RepID=A0A4S1DVY2_9FLAO|nr:SRPBCC family protein [Flavivirga rizhaonensis]TGV02267.1 hypothetical protein EM932_12025 [Flavivirga rizhaonensis]